MMEANMNSEFKQTPLESIDCDTIELLPVNCVKPSQACRAIAGIVAGVNFPDGSQVLSAAVGAAVIILLIGGYSLWHAVTLVLAGGSVFPAVPTVAVYDGLLLVGILAGAAIFAARQVNASRRDRSAAQQFAQYRIIAPLGRGGGARSTWPSIGC